MTEVAIRKAYVCEKANNNGRMSEDVAKCQLRLRWLKAKTLQSVSIHDMLLPLKISGRYAANEKK